MDVTPFYVSLNLGLWTTGILVLGALPLAWFFHQSRGLWKRFLEPLISLPLVVSPTVLGFYFLVLYSPNQGPGAWLEENFGLRLAFTFPGMVIASAVSGLPFMYTALRAGLSQLPPNLIEASLTLGKSMTQTWLRVVIPVLRPALITGCITTFAHTLGEFGVVFMIGGSIPGVTKTVSITIFEQVESLNFEGAQAYALVMIAVGYLALFTIGVLRPKDGKP